MIKKVAIYCRVSTEEQVKFGVSIEAQKERLKAYAKENRMEVVNEYIDEGISASTIHKRPALVRMLDNLKTLDLVIFTKLDRFSRNVLDANNLIKTFDEANCAFKAIDEEDSDISTADGRFMFNLKVNLAERERLKTSERIKTAFDYKVNQGTVLTNSFPLGYKVVEKRLVIDEETADIARTAFKLFLENHSKRKTLFEINKIFNLSMKYTSLNLLLKNKLYIGEYRNNKDYCPAIIDIKTFNHTQALIGKNVKLPPSGRIYLFSSLLKCGVCGCNYTVNHSKGYSIYRCCGKREGKCSESKCISEIKLEKYLIKNFKLLLHDFVLKIEEEQSRAKTKTPSYLKEEQAIEKKLTRLKDLYLNELIQINDYKKEYNKLTLELDKIRKSKANQEQIKNITQLKELLNSNIENMYNGLSKEKKKEFWLTAFDYIVVYSFAEMNVFFKY